MEFEELAKRFSPYIKYLALKSYIPSSAIDKEDLYQEMLASLWERWRKGELTDKTDGYIKGSCYFVLKNYLRKFREKAKLVSLQEPLGEDDVTLEELIPDQKSLLLPERLDDAIFIQQMKERELTRREKEVAEFLSQSYTLREIGERLGISHVMVLKIKKEMNRKFKGNR
ncbi:MAG: sigma-70 family RNA polymerase sigma factor [bacterium]